MSFNFNSPIIKAAAFHPGDFQSLISHKAAVAKGLVFLLNVTPLKKGVAYERPWDERYSTRRDIKEAARAPRAIFIYRHLL